MRRYVLIIALSVFMIGVFSEHIYAQDSLYYYVPGDIDMAQDQLWQPQFDFYGGSVTYLVNYYRGISEACLMDGFYCSADVNGDCLITGGDVAYFVAYFRELVDEILYCPDYPTPWILPEDLPAMPPPGWPYCD